MRKIVKLAIWACVILILIGIWMSLSRGARGDVLSVFKWLGSMLRQGWGFVSHKA
ncbi:MAG: hypothetical protein II014_02615 [Bifidobacteriaceae bacterium]|nr:hypothetical protein [Aeriscardovia sp.]MBQ1804137.1 hypothetical protein [Bifidobacteriaceae bacterium]